MSSWLICVWFIAISHSDVGMIILSLMAILSVIAISSMNDHQVFSSFWTSEVFIFFGCFSHFLCHHTVWYVCAWFYCMNGDVMLIFLHPYLLCSFAWIANLWWIVVALGSIVFWCCIGVSILVFFEACVIGLQHLSSIFLPAICGLIILTSWVKQQWWNFSRPCSIPSAFLSMLP